MFLGVSSWGKRLWSLMGITSGLFRHCKFDFKKITIGVPLRIPQKMTFKSLSRRRLGPFPACFFIAFYKQFFWMFLSIQSFKAFPAIRQLGTMIKFSFARKSAYNKIRNCRNLQNLHLVQKMDLCVSLYLRKFVHSHLVN